MLRATAAEWSPSLPIYHSSLGKSQPLLGLQGWRSLEEQHSYQSAKGGGVSRQAALCSESTGKGHVTVLAQWLALGRHFVAMHGKDGRREGKDGCSDGSRQEGSIGEVDWQMAWSQSQD